MKPKVLDFKTYRRLLNLHLNYVNRTQLFWKTCFLSNLIFHTFLFIAAVVEDFPPDLSQPTNLLVTLLTYSSIAVQNTKGIECTIRYFFILGVSMWKRVLASELEGNTDCTIWNKSYNRGWHSFLKENDNFSS